MAMFCPSCQYDLRGTLTGAFVVAVAAAFGAPFVPCVFGRLAQLMASPIVVFTVKSAVAVMLVRAIPVTRRGFIRGSEGF